ncbi:hypothetical protein MMC09_000202 [Bachmanniomyces sp. S44760]|nr:hypothetical protein [Bachmanniomyces sp. S44760]
MDDTTTNEVLDSIGTVQPVPPISPSEYSLGTSHNGQDRESDVGDFQNALSNPDWSSFLEPCEYSYNASMSVNPVCVNASAPFSLGFANEHEHSFAFEEVKFEPVLHNPTADVELEAPISSISEIPQELVALPTKRERRGWRQMRHIYFGTYQRLFTVANAANAVAVIVLLSQSRHGVSPTSSSLATAAAVNLVVTVAVRQEYFFNSVLHLALLTPRSAPLRLRRMLARVHHYAGFHSACAIACTAWFLLFAIFVTIDWVAGQVDSIAVLVVTYIILIELTMICTFAIPRLRSRSHNVFENVHRLAGWSSLILFWTLVMLLASNAHNADGELTPIGVYLVQQPSFWCLIMATLCIIRPWLHLRKLPVEIEHLSKHAIRFRFSSYLDAPGAAVRISTSPLKEWHAFACIPDSNNGSFSLIVSNAGDWTKQQIKHPQHHYYVRGIPTVSFATMARIFERVVFVATGSGIGPVLAVVVTHKLPCRILWSCQNPLQTYGIKVIGEVFQADPQAMVIDTHTSGRPNMVELSYHLFVRTNAEAVYIISNPKVTQKVVYGLESRGVPAYGPIFDS